MSLLDDDEPAMPPTVLQLCVLAGQGAVVSYQLVGNTFGYFFEHAACLLEQIQNPDSVMQLPSHYEPALRTLCQITNDGLATNRKCAHCNKPLFPRI